ncbi:hypothetical protein [Kingella potus]|nr:hypothetical protein [Kingella potus]
MMNQRENIQELDGNLQAFPSAERVFSEKQPWLKEHFMPLISIDLAALNPEWQGRVVHMLCPFEPFECYIGEETAAHHNEFTAPNWFAFRLNEDNQYEFLGNEGYFLRTAVNHWDFDSEAEKYFQKMQENVYKSQENVAKFGYLVSVNYPEYNGKHNICNFLDNMGGGLWYGNWTESAEMPSAFKMSLPPVGTTWDKLDELPNDGIEISYQGNPFYFIADVAGYNYCGSGADAIILMYEPVSQIVLFTFDWT